MDDIQEKARRNLVVYSSGILAIQFLGIPFNGQLLGVAKLDQVNPVHAWIAAGVVLAYLWFRYRFAPKNASGIHEHETEIASAITATVTDRVVSQFMRVIDGQRPVGIRFSEIPQPVNMTATQVSNISITWQGERHGTVGFEWVGFGPTDAHEFARHSGRHQVPFKLSRRLSAIARLGRILRRYQISWEMLEYRIPALLANAAGVVCVLQIANLLP